MKESKAYTGSHNGHYMPSRSGYVLTFFILLAFILHATPVSGQEEELYDEFPVYVRVSYIGVTEIDAVISEETVYLSVTGLFDFLKISYFVKNLS